MHNNSDRSLKVLLALLTLGVWGVLLRPFFFRDPAKAQAQSSPQVGRYAIVSDSSTITVLDTATGTYKRTDQQHTFTSTWDKNYLHGVLTPTPPADKK